MKSLSKLKIFISRVSLKFSPMVWVIIIVLTAVLFSSTVVWIQERQQQFINHYDYEQTMLRKAQIDLLKAYLHISLADSPQSPFDYKQGLSLLDQAGSSLERALMMQQEFNKEKSIKISEEKSQSPIVFFMQSVTEFRRMVINLHNSNYKMKNQQTELRIAFFALERKADIVDSQIQNELSLLMVQYDKYYSVVLYGSGVLLSIFCAVLYIGGLARKRADEALRVSEELYRTTLYSIGDGVISTDQNGNIKQMNIVAEGLTGWNEADSIGKPLDEVFKIINEETRNTVENPVKKVIQEGKIIGLANHTLLISKDGRETPIADSGSPIFNSSEKIIGVILIFRDQTEERIAQQKISESEERLRFALSGTNDGLWDVKMDTGEVYMSPRGCEILGYGPSELEQVIKLWNELVNPEDLPITNERLLAHLEGKTEIFDVNQRLRTKSGEWKWIKARGKIVARDENGKPIRMTGTHTDISERVRVEEALRRSEQEFREIFNSTGESIFIHDASSGEILDVNQRTIEMFGFDNKEELLNCNVGNLSSDKFLFTEEVAQENLQKTILEGSLTFDWHSKKKNGETFWTEVSLKKTEIGGQDRILAVVRDITERKRTEEELQKHHLHLEELVEERTEEIDTINRALIKEIERKEEVEKQLQDLLEKEKELVKLKSRFISTASHEFRTPLTSVLSSAELIQRYGKIWTEDKFNLHINRIKNSVDYLTKLMDDVLTMNRNDTGKIVLTPALIDLHKLCRSLLEDFQIKLNSRQRINLEYAALSDEYNLDLKQLKIILQNLMSNAIKYSQGGGLINLKISSEQEFLRLEISDEGIGVPEEDLPRLFEPFHRSINAEDIQGTGLGLSIVKSAVELHNGTITVASVLGKGTTFTVKLPANN